MVTWVSAGVLVALADGAVVWGARGVERLYAADAYWLVAAYAEPWRTAAVSAVVVSTLAVSVSAATARPALSWARTLATSVVMIAGLAVCLELTRAVHLNDALGQLYVHTFVLRRAKVSFERDERGWCLRSDLSSPFTWRLNGNPIHPRLLPLPYESNAVVTRLSRASRRCVAQP